MYQKLLNSKITNILSLIGIAILVFIYIYLVFPYFGNYVIFKDDLILYIYQFMEYYYEEESFFSKFLYLFKESNWPHPHIASRFIGMLTYEITGEINFKVYYIFGHIAIISLFFILKLISNIKSWIAFVPVALLFFIPAMPNSFWMVALIGYIFQLIFSLSTIYFYTKRKIFLFILFSILTVFSSGAGIFIFIPILFMEIIKLIQKKGSWISFAATVVLASILLVVLITVLEERQTTQGSSSLINSVLNLPDLGNKILVFFAYLGQSLKLPLSKTFVYSAAYIGVLLFAYNIFLFIKDKNRQKANLPIYLFILYLFILGVFIALIRSKNQYGAPVIWYRYEYFSTIYLCILAILSYKIFDKKYIPLFAFLIIATINYLIKAPNNFGSVRGQQLFRLESTVNLLQGERIGGQITRNLNKAVKTGVFKPLIDYPILKSINGSDIGKEGGIHTDLYDIKTINKTLSIKGIALNPKIANTGYYKTYFLFKHIPTGKIYSVQARNNKPKNIKNILDQFPISDQTKQLFQKKNTSRLGFSIKMLRYQVPESMPAGSYQLGIMLAANKLLNHVFTENIVKIESPYAENKKTSNLSIDNFTFNVKKNRLWMEISKPSSLNWNDLELYFNGKKIKYNIGQNNKILIQLSSKKMKKNTVFLKNTKNNIESEVYHIICNYKNGKVKLIDM